MLKKLLFDSFIYAFLPKLPMIIGVFVMPITTKYLTPLDYGVYGVIMAYFGVLAGFRELGMGVNLSNVFFKHKKYYKLIWRNLLGFYYVWGAIYALMFSLLLLLIIPEEAGDNKYMIIGFISIPILLFSPYQRIGTLYYQLERKPVAVTTIGISSALVGIGISFYCVVYLEWGYLSWFISSFISTSLSGIIYLIIFIWKKKFTPIFRFNKSTYKRYLKIGIPMVPHQYASYLLNSSDRVVMDLMGTSNEDIGRYNFAYNFGNMAQQVSQGVNIGSRPYLLGILADKTEDSDIKYKKLTFLIMGTSIVASFIGCLWLKEIFQLLVNNDELRNMYPLAIVIIMSYNFGPMYQSIATHLSFHEKTNALWKMSFVASAINIVLNLIFIPIYGYQAAAATTMVSLLYLGFIGLRLKSYKMHQKLNYHGLLWVLAIVFMTVSCYFLVEMSILIKIIISVVFILAILYNIKRIKSFIKILR